MTHATDIPLSEIQAAWDDAARQDATGNIMTVDGTTRDEFFESGRREVAGVMDRLDALGLRHREELAMDFGCGVGRLAVALVHEYDRVVAVDVSREMIRRAELHQRIRYMRVSTLKVFASAVYDLIYSSIALQHLPPRLQATYIRDFIRLLRRDGAAVFDVPDGASPVEVYDCQSMFATPRAIVEEWVQEVGGTVADVEATGAGGPSVSSLRYIVTRRA